MVAVHEDVGIRGIRVMGIRFKNRRLHSPLGDVDDFRQVGSPAQEPFLGRVRQDAALKLRVMEDIVLDDV